MPLDRAIVYCQNYNSFESGQTVAQAVFQKMGRSPDLLILFCTIQHDIDQLLAGVRSVLADSPIIGCTGLGMITPEGCDHASHSVAAMGLKSEQVRFQPFLFPDLSQNTHQVGQQMGHLLAKAQAKSSDRQLLFLFHDPLASDCVSLFSGLKQSYPFHVDVVGGAAGNDYLIGKTYQFFDVAGDRQIMTDAASGFLMIGDFHYQIGISHGSRSIGEFRTVTKAEEAIIFEIDHEPALNLLEALMGEDRLHDVEQLVNSVCLGVPLKGQNYSEDTIIRVVAGFDPDTNSIRVSNPMPEGTQFQITRRQPSRVLQETQSMATKLINHLQEPDQAIYFYFNCDGRGAYLFGEPEPDVEALQAVIGDRADLFGFFCFAETSPVAHENTFHACTGILIAVE
ncbi:MAG: FIST N-terminal domain-containing protein [Cyanobacteria bacterium P01_E01_bin.6]